MGAIREKLFSIGSKLGFLTAISGALDVPPELGIIIDGCVMVLYVSPFELGK